MNLIIGEHDDDEVAEQDEVEKMKNRKDQNKFCDCFITLLTRMFLKVSTYQLWCHMRRELTEEQTPKSG